MDETTYQIDDYLSLIRLSPPFMGWKLYIDNKTVEISDAEMSAIMRIVRQHEEEQNTRGGKK